MKIEDQDENETFLKEDIVKEVTKWLEWHKDLNLSSCTMQDLRLYLWLKTLMDIIKKYESGIK